MKTELNEILKNIRDSIESYDDQGIFSQDDLRESLKTLDCNLFYLASHRVKAYEEWLSVYFKYKDTTSNAEAEKLADKEVPELYKFRKIDSAARKISDGLRSQISSNNKE